jgi:hypothetical protein
MPEVSLDYDLNVFINCPFDSDYKPLFDAIVFAVQITGFIPRCAREASNSGDFRLEKIMSIISECKYGVHDLSRTELGSNGLPRFNMPLGLDIGCKRFGSERQKRKRLLIVDKSRYRYQKFISDIAGQDVEPHSKDVNKVIRSVRDWLSTESANTGIPGGDYISSRYRVFQKDLPVLCKSQRRSIKKLTFGDLTYLIRIWLEEREI